MNIAKNENILEKESTFKEIIKYLVDFIYLLDFLISIFRGYFNYEMKIIRDNKGILIHYLKQNFFTDLIEGIPIYSLLRIFNNKVNINSNAFDYKMFFIKLLLFIKPFKIFKIIRTKKNKALEDFYRYLSVFYYLEKTVFFIISSMIFLLFIHLFICLHIFFALQSYPNWISYSNVANESFIRKYIASFYFLITTLTTVGYGDIVCISTYERIFHIILLGIGTILYSFIVSKIGNYLREQSYEEMKLDKDLTILESIRLTHPSMPFKLYIKIKNHLLDISKKRKKTGLSLLINDIPETIKNELLLKIYSKVVNNFNIFKGVNNSHFVIQVLTSFIPIVFKRDETLILEGELINNIIFVKDGRLSLEISIDLNDPYKSIQDYLMNNFNGISRKNEMKLYCNITRKNSVLNIEKKNFGDLKNEIDNLLLDKHNIIDANQSNDNGISMDLGRLNFSMNKNEKSLINDYQLIKIIDIRKNEHFGDIFMFLQKPSPFTLTVKSRLAEIFLLRKHDAIIISESFSNIWRRIYKNSYHNLVSIKELIHNRLTRYYNTYFFNKDKKIVNISKLDATINSKLSKRSSKSEISKDIRKTQTISCANTIINKKNNIQKYTDNRLDLPKIRKISEDRTYNDISFSDSLTNSINNFEKSYSSYGDNNKNDKKPINEELKKMTINKFSFGKKSQKHINSIKNNNNNTNKKLTFSKEVNNVKENTSTVKYRKKTAAFKNMEKNGYDEDNTNTEKISNYSSEENNFLVLEDINADFAKRIKKDMNKRSKIEKVKNLFELQKQQYTNILNEIFSQINNQSLNGINYKNILDIQKQLNESISNNCFLSKIIESDEDKSILYTKRNIKFDTKILKKITSESFEIKSSYENINKLSNGEIIKNMKYKNYLEFLIQKYLNNNNFNKDEEDYNYYNKKDIEKNTKSIFKNKTLITKFKALDLNDKKGFIKINDNDFRNRETKQKSKSKFLIQSSKQITVHHPSIDELKKEVDLIQIKEDNNKNNINNKKYKKFKSATKKIYYHLKKSKSEKKENESNIILKNSTTINNDFEKNNNKISNLSLLNFNHAKLSNEKNFESINNVGEANKKCIII